jgi:hypothetical protein
MRQAEPAHDPLESVEALARCEARGAGAAVVPLVVAHLTDRGLLDVEPADLAARHGLARRTVRASMGRRGPVWRTTRWRVPASRRPSEMFR